MNLDVGQIVVWIAIGFLAGSLVGMILSRDRGRIMNIIIGMIGAVIGGALFSLLNLDLFPGINFAFTLNDIVAAVVGAIILVVALRILR